MKITYLIGFILLFCFQASSQEIIELENPSFEDESHIGGMVPYSGKGFVFDGWKNCATEEELSPGIHIHSGEWFGVKNIPFHGSTYLGMLGRADGSHESVSSVLSSSLEEGKRYRFSVLLCKAETYSMVDRLTGIKTNYINPMVLRVYGGFTHCQKLEKLGETVRVYHTDWRLYEFSFEPFEEYTHLTFEVYYDTSAPYPYNGNLLLDDCSDLIENTTVRFPDLEIESLTEEELDLLIIDYGNNNFEKITGEEYYIPVQMRILHNVWKFEDNCDKVGIRKYITDVSREDLLITIKCLETLGVKKPVEILKKLYLINAKKGEGVTEEEVSFFENSEHVFEETLQEEALDEKRRIYIKNNRQALIQEMRNLQ